MQAQGPGGASRASSMAVNASRLLFLLLLLPALVDALPRALGIIGEEIYGLEKWTSNEINKCDMAKPVFLAHGGPGTGAPGYTEGAWAMQNEERKSVLSAMPMECEEGALTACPIQGCTTAGVATPSGYCSAYHDACYSSRNGATFTQNLANFAYTWLPSNGCFFSPLAIMNGQQYHSWAKAIEAAAGPTLFVGDGHVAQLFLALQSLTSNAPNSEFARADTLVNTHTLAPMTSAQIDACVADASAPVPNTALKEPPCPPRDATSNDAASGEDNRWHNIDQMKWAKTLEDTRGPGDTFKYKTLILGTGSELWRSHAYPAFLHGCQSSGGVADAFRPLSALGDGSVTSGCDVFSVRYPVMVQNIARFLSNLRVGKGQSSGGAYYDGHVILLTTPPHVEGCASVATPNAAPTTAASPTSDPNLAAYYYKQVQYAETVWQGAFKKWAPRIKFSVLNVTHLSSLRADARLPGDCGHFCYPGMPHVWAEMLLRLLEQHHGLDQPQYHGFSTTKHTWHHQGTCHGC